MKWFHIGMIVIFFAGSTTVLKQLTAVDATLAAKQFSMIIFVGAWLLVYLVVMGINWLVRKSERGEL